MNELNINNKVALVGTIISKFTYDHEVHGEKFYKGYLTVARKSGTEDVLPLMFSERIIDVTADFIGCRVKVDGHLRSYSLHENNGKHKLKLSVLVVDVDDAGELRDSSTIVLEGFLCKKPVYRETLLGKEIADCLLAVNRAYGKSDYIPCIAWGRNAGYVSQFDIGTKLRLEGRIQSRTYNKKLSETEFEERTAYEVSIGAFAITGANR